MVGSLAADHFFALPFPEVDHWNLMFNRLVINAVHESLNVGLHLVGSYGCFSNCSRRKRNTARGVCGFACSMLRHSVQGFQLQGHVGGGDILKGAR